MCLKIITHFLVCDVRPVMPHPRAPAELIVDPFTAPTEGCCCCCGSDGAPPDRASAEARDPSLRRCPTHACCCVRVRSFPCGCGRVVGYHQYARITPPHAAAKAAASTGRPAAGAGQPWRVLRSVDYVMSAGTPGQRREPSEQLRVARRGVKFSGDRLWPKAKRLQESVVQMKEQLRRVREGGPYGPDFDAGVEELGRLDAEAKKLKAEYETWKGMKEKLERYEYGKMSGVHRSG
ncbi:hypothetical protein GGR56DRAFT_673820 [Xylariaceae sp. FL0804]|nr:hypothetical protein GGR56DRAFT_673820 [Xylariaceae sp. FL0804]